MRIRRLTKPTLALAVVLAVGGSVYLTRGWWQRDHAPSDGTTEASATKKFIVSDEAQANLGIVAKAIKPETFWKTVQVPGMVADRPGRSDRGIVAPATGVVSRVAVYPGDSVRPGDVLFTLKLLSETLHQTQTELFKATQEIKIAQAQKKRLSASSGAVPESKVIEAESQITRLEVAAAAYRQELQTRGFPPERIAEAAEGKFVTELPVVAPQPPADPMPTSPAPGEAPTYEVQELKIDLGQQVTAGQTLCVLSNHQSLVLQGRAFRDETPLLEKSVRENWPVEVDFQEDPASDWPPLEQPFRIRRLANTIDPVNRTFEFLVPLENQSRTVESGGHTQHLWRFRPGQKVKLLVKVERIDNVFVLPSEAVARQGAEAFVFTQNVNTFERHPVRVLLQDRQRVVLPNDGSLIPGSFVVRTAAAQLNRMAQSQSSGLPKGYHIHADGSLHKNEDEGK